MDEQVVIFGGSFNPVHMGHLIVARDIAERLGAAKVVLMPAAAPPHKETPLAPAADRLAMLRLATEGDPLFEVSTIEIDRRGVSYTFDTLTHLADLHADVELVWVVGMDMLADLPAWYRADEVVELARIVTVARPPMPADLDERFAGLARRFGAERARRLIDDIASTTLIDISSTAIRDRVRRGRPIDYLTPAPVVRYIRERGLYRAADVS